MPSTRVSILLATFQGQRYLPELLRSIQGQSHDDWTLLVRDDGSSDATPQIIREAAAKDRRITIAASDGLRQGAIGNFAWLLEQARQLQTDYFLLADQDDIWHRDKVARQVEALAAAEAAAGRAVPQLVFCDAAVIDAAGRPLHASFLRQNRLPYGPGRLKTLLGRSFVLGCACAVNRGLVELALPVPDVVASHDWWLALCAAAAGGITCLDVPLLDYRRHAANASQPAIWNVFGRGGTGWRCRWKIGWQNFLQSLAQARSLRDRLRERGIIEGEPYELIDAYCRIVEQPGRWRRLRELRRLGAPDLDWPRRLLFDFCLMRL
jgi:glycosyltransferase involved in cell wall biosynthesis